MTRRGRRTVLSTLPVLAALVLSTAAPVAGQSSGAPDDGRVTGRAPEPRGAATFPALRVTTVVSGLEIPWDVQQLPGGHLMITERTKRRILVKDGAGLHAVAFPRASVWAEGETGLMSLAVDPAFGQGNRRFYTCHGRALPDNRHDIAVVAWRLAPDRRSASRVRDLVTGIQITTGRHGGCRLLVRRDGLMFVGTGDSAVGTNPQNLRSLNGKVLRLDYRTGDPWPTNPWIGAASVKKRYVYNYGHRNIQGLALRKGGTLWSVEHGSFRDDEVNEVLKGANYGWDPVPNDAGDPQYNEEVPMTDLVKYPNAVRAAWSSGTPTVATSGAAFVRGDRWGRYDGMLAVACLKESQVIFMRFDADGDFVRKRVPSALQQFGRLRSVTRAANGDFLITTSNGVNDRVLRVRPA